MGGARRRSCPKGTNLTRGLLKISVGSWEFCLFFFRYAGSWKAIELGLPVERCYPQCRSLMLSFRRESAIVPNRPSSVGVKSSPRTPAAASDVWFGSAQPPAYRFVLLQAYSFGV
jgi:hypothetical protein